MKEAVLLLNLGTPDSPHTSAVRRYLSQFLNDRRVIDIHPVARFFLVNFIIVPFRSFRSARLYKKIWTKEGSPLLIHGEELKRKLQQHLGDKYIVELAMRYQQPSIKVVLEKLRKQAPVKIHVLPLYPQYASSSTGSSIEETFRQIRRWEVIPDIEVTASFFRHSAYLGALVEKAKQYDPQAYDHVIFSYHGLPERQILKASESYGASVCRLGECCNKITQHNQYCYRAGCLETTRQLVNALQLKEGGYTTSFQSRLNDKWLKPYSDKVVEELAKKGAKRLLVFSPAFVADCLETTYEIGTEYDEIFRHNGGEKVTLVESLNADDHWIRAVAQIVKPAR
jgi:protoporphyrin/coproporphyrin ferrochelatase